MIRYALVCDHDHPFEGWFAASADYDDQAVRGLIECPVCASHVVRKQIMAPAVSGVRKRAAARAEIASAKQEAMAEVLAQVRAHVEENCDYVGDAFASEARAIHEGKSEERGIYGEATPSEVTALVKDGVPIAPLPPEPPKKTELN